MASVERQKVRFTGKRTGLESIAIKGVGVIHRGQVIEVDADEAERWATPLAMRDGKEGSDFSKVGSSTKVEEGDVPLRKVTQRERIHQDDDVLFISDTSTELAHGVNPEEGRAEEESVERREEVTGGGKGEKASEKSSKK